MKKFATVVVCVSVVFGAFPTLAEGFSQIVSKEEDVTGSVLDALLNCLSRPSVDEIKEKAEAGDAESQFNLGSMYSQGNEVKQDYFEAFKWWNKAAEQGYVGAQSNLGFMYDNGRGVKQNYYEAFKWYRKAAEQNFADAQYNLGFMYENGEGVSKDYKEAAKWYRKAAQQGDSDAQNALKRLGVTW